MISDKGQSLLELVVVMAVAIVVMGALVAATITSLRNANFSKNQLQATKYAQEAIEKIRSIRDRNGGVLFVYGGGSTEKFDDLWMVKIKDNCTNPCNFLLDSVNNNLIQNDNGFETLGDGFKRYIKITDVSSNYQTRKTITVIVRWVDFAGEHESKLATILSKL